MILHNLFAEIKLRIVFTVQLPVLFFQWVIIISFYWLFIIYKYVLTNLPQLISEIVLKFING